MIDFKKKKRGFASIMESLKSDKSKFDDLSATFLAKKTLLHSLVYEVFQNLELVKI